MQQMTVISRYRSLSRRSAFMVKTNLLEDHRIWIHDRPPKPIVPQRRRRIRVYRRPR